MHEDIGVCGVPLQCFESYLTGRKQAINITNTSSSECDLIYMGCLKGLCWVRSCSGVPLSRLEPLRASVGWDYICMQTTHV